MCRLEQERHRWRETLQQRFKENRVEIRVNLDPLKATTALPYLVLYINLRKAQQIWGVLAKVLGMIGAPVKARAMM